MSTPITHQPGYEAYKRSIFFPYEAAIAIKTDDTENIHRWFEFSKPQDHDINQCQYDVLCHSNIQLRRVCDILDINCRHCSLYCYSY